MKKLIYAIVIVVIQHSTLSIQNAVAQALDDNIGSGNALNFDGVSDRVSVGTLNFSDGANPWSVSCWIKPETSGTPVFWGTKVANQGMVIYWDDNDNDRVRIGKWANDVLTNSISCPKGEWSHIAYTYDGSELTSYVNGEFAGQVSVTFSVVMGDATVGNAGTPGFAPQFYGGIIDEVQIWNKSLAQSEIQGSMCKHLIGNEAGLVGYWNMNEGTGTTIGDLTANENDGTLF